MNHPCNETQKLAPLAVGGDLDPEPLEALRLHVEGCPACAELMRAAETARAAYRGALPQAGSVDLWPAIRRRMVAETRTEAERAPRSPLRRLPTAVRATAALAAAAALLFLARPWLSGAPENQAGDQPAIAEVTDFAPPADASTAVASASAFPVEALSGVSARPAGELPGGTLAGRTARHADGGGLMRMEGPTMGEELRQQALQAPRGGAVQLRGIPWGPQGADAQAASSRSWPR